MCSLPDTPRPDAPPEVKALTARNGLPSLTIGNAAIHSTYDPLREAESWARGLLEDPEAARETLWIVFGCGLGYQVQALAQGGLF